MPLTRIVAGALLVGLLHLDAGTASGQDYPSKPIRIVASGAGSNTDIIARYIAPAIAASLSQQLIVENRPSNVMAEIVAKTPPDGYTLLFIGGAFWIAPLLQTVNYDPLNDFAPITLAASTPDLLVVHPSLPVNSVKELIAFAKARPGELNYSMSGIGGSAHLEAELFKSLAGVNIVSVAYKGNPEQITALLGGEVQLSFSGPSTVTSHLKSGKLRALAIASAQPSARFPGLPTVAASLPFFEPVSEIAFFVPAKTPPAVISRLNQEIVRALNQADVKEKLFNAGIDVIGSSSEQVTAKMKSQMATMGKVIKDAGIKVQ